MERVKKSTRKTIEQTCSPWQGGWTESAVGKSGPLVEFPWQGWYQDRYLPQTDRQVKEERMEEEKEKSSSMEKTKVAIRRC